MPRPAAFKNWHKRLTRQRILFDAISAEDEPVFHEAIAEDAHLSTFLYFVSSGQGIQLNSAFLQIEDRKMRCDVLAMIEGIARVSAD